LESHPHDKIRLAVIQATSFCNIDCKYCYLPDRNSKALIGLDVLALIFERIAASPLYSGYVEFLWHCGEPLSAGIDFYSSAVKLQTSIFGGAGTFSNTIQTNGTLLTPEWCSLLRENNFRVGVSVDGPVFIHDAQRVRRNGAGTYDDVMRGVALLRAADIRFGCLSVLTAASLSYPVELCSFFAEHEFTWVGFNVEEIESANRKTTVSGKMLEYRRFWDSFLAQWDRTGRPFEVREVSDLLHVMRAIRRDDRDAHTEAPDETVPFRIVSFNRNGDFSTFSPELLSTSGGARYGDFHLGNVRRDEITPSLLREREFVSDVLAGVERCRSECDYYPVCGGAFVSNRWAENAAFDSLETTACKLHRKILADSVIDWIANR
jgi:uncharacterized protein